MAGERAESLRMCARADGGQMPLRKSLRRCLANARSGLGVIVALAGCLAIAGGCAGQVQPILAPATSAAEPLPATVTSSTSGQRVGAALGVVATTGIIGDMARNVGGDRVTVSVLLPTSVDPHTYQPTPADMQKLAQARVVLRNGIGLDDWLDRLAESSGASARVVTVSDGVALRHGDEGGAAAAEAHDNVGNEADPHVWMDVRNAMTMARNIADALTRADPAGAEVYASNLAKYTGQLSELDGWIERQVAAIAPERRKLVATHEALGYFADRYGFEVVGTVVKGLQAEREPSAHELAELVEQIRAEGVAAIFVESTMNPRLAMAVAQEAGVEVVSSLYTGSLGPEGSPASTYIEMMRYDVETIVGALR